MKIQLNTVVCRCPFGKLNVVSNNNGRTHKCDFSVSIMLCHNVETLSLG